MPKKKKGTWGGKRPNTGGPRPNSGRRPDRGKAKRGTVSFYIEIGLAGKVQAWSDHTGNSKGEIVEQALTEFFDRLEREGYAE